MTQTQTLRQKSPRSQNGRSGALGNTLRCVLVLGVIAVVCVALLAVANRFLKTEIQLDKDTSALINQIAPTGADDNTAHASYIKMVDLGKGGYALDDLDAYNKKYGSSSRKVRALYTSTHKDTGKVTLVVEAEGKGYVDAVVMLIAYDQDNKISGIVTKSQSESFWSHIKDVDQLYKAFIGTSGKIESDSIASQTGVTVKYTLDGMVGAVNIANDFVARLGGDDQGGQTPVAVTDPEKLEKLAVVSDAQTFLFTAVDTATVAGVYAGNNGDYIVEAASGLGSHSEVTLLVKIENGTVVKVAHVSDGFSEYVQFFRDNTELNKIFAGKTAADVAALDAKELASSTGATKSAQGVCTAVANALAYAAEEA
ncbi:MAG: hypothetical protein HFE46_01435 [Clostridia bacterium]|nr:hypothetical protein [Clostridia bacterium]